MPHRLLLTLALLTLPTRATDWPQWRGPTGQGLSTDKTLPTKWDAKTNENIAWKSPLPKSDTPYSSPIVVAGKVFVTIAINADRQHRVLCFDAKTGKELWNVAVAPGPWLLTDLRGGYAAPTPAADSAHVYALFGSGVLAALDHAGNQVWRYELPNATAFDVAIGCSPLLVGDTVIVQADTTKKQSALIALDCKTGKPAWHAPRPTVNFAHSTPTLIDLAGKPLLLVAAFDALQGVDPATGAVVWSAKAKGDTVSPVYSADAKLAYIDSGRGGPGYAISIDPAAAGDVTKTHTKWTLQQVPEAFGSPVILNDRLYRLHAPGILKTYNLADGAELSSLRLEGATPAASLVATPDHLYAASAGTSFVLTPGDTPAVLSKNDLADNNYASPATADGAIYLKGRKFLWCLRAK
ncbi:MAG TPA: PQQ-binding-like beta-propeller repeat protein [Tepidisphaeraceae bacterium]|nr:PQQ-binding-like beta-propeller repeat protein [Tepidisphaeraceae bacterium]